MPSPRIYYLAPDYDVPSWGNGMLYHHVRLLRDLGFDAFLLHERSPFRMTWIDVDAPIRYLDVASPAAPFRPEPCDVLVVPEVQAHSARLAEFHCRKVVFIQGSFLILNAFERAVDYRELGFEAAITVMVHIRDIVQRHFGLTPAIVPPFIAPYFFANENALDRPRRKRVLLSGKSEYRKAGYIDFDIVRKILEQFVADRPGWEVVELAGFDHRQTAQIMKESAALVNVNCLESFNAVVPEAMAAGCLVWCYEAYGGRDFIRPGVNAFAWPNNYVYPLVEGLCDVLETYDARESQLSAIRRAAHKTANQFQEKGTASALSAFYGQLLRAIT